MKAPIAQAGEDRFLTGNCFFILGPWNRKMNLVILSCTVLNLCPKSLNL